MGRHTQAAQVPDEVACVTGPFRAQSGRPPDAALEHPQGGLPFGVAACLGQLDIDYQPVTVLGQQTTQVAEPGILLLALAVEPRLQICGRGVRIATAMLAWEVGIAFAHAAS